MATINDSSGIFVGAVLDAFNQVETLVARDGDLVGAQAEIMLALRRIVHTKAVVSGSGTTYIHRA